MQVVPLPFTHSLARKDVSYSCLRGARAPVMAQRRLNISACAPAVRCLNRSLLYRVWRLPFRSTPFMRMLSTCPCPLASNCLTWAALSQPQSCFGLSTHDDVSSLWPRGATAPCFFSQLDCSVLSWRPIHPGQLEPTTLPLCRLTPVSCSVGLSPTLSLPFSLALSCSLLLSLS